MVPHLQNVGKGCSWPQFPHLHTQSLTVILLILPQALRPAGWAQRFWDLLDGGDEGWETCGLLQHCCQSFPPSLEDL